MKRLFAFVNPTAFAFGTGDASHVPSLPAATQADDADSTLDPADRMRPHRRPGQQQQHQPPYKRQRVSNDELRLVPNYETPADAVFLPSPETWAYGQEPIPVMKPSKPGRNQSFKPVNTIDDVSYLSNKPKPQRTYGVSTKPGRYQGQRAYLDREREFSSQSTPTTRSALERRHSPKRLKTHHHGSSPNGEVINLDSDDDITLVDVQPSTRSASFGSPEVPPSVTSRSQRSGDNTRLSSTPMSGFEQVSNFVDPRRKKHRRQSNVPIAPEEEESQPVSPSVMKRMNVFKKAEDMALSRRRLVPDEDELGAIDKATVPPRVATKSNGSSRINPSTEGRTGAHKKYSNNLRDSFQRAPEPESIEDHDELAGDVAVTVHGRSKPLPKQASNRKSASNRKAARSVTGPWALAYAKSYDLDERGPGLILTPGERAKSLEIQRRVGDKEPPELLDTIDSAKVTSGFTDGLTRIRIKGSAPSNGDSYWYDLKFQNEGELGLVQAVYLSPGLAEYGKFTRKDESYMEKMFDKPLSRRPVPDSPTLIPDPGLPLANAMLQGGKTSHAPRRMSIIETTADTQAELDLRRGSKDSLEGALSRPEHSSAIPTSRPLRVTRNSQQFYGDKEEAHTTPEQEPKKYSIEHGLGKRWPKPVQYGSGRRRALVDFDDLSRLDEGEFLNDALIDFYMIYLFEQANIAQDKVYFFNTHFYTTLTRTVPGQKGGINYPGVARWTAKEDIFNYDYIVVPVCESTHWYLAIICNVANISRKLIVDDSNQSTPVPETSAEGDVQSHSEPKVDTSAELAEDTVPTAAVRPIHDTADSESLEDPNLFDEEQRRLHEPNINNTIYELEPPMVTSESSIMRHSPTNTETVRLGKLTIDDSIPKGIIGDASSSPPCVKKKAKRKSGAAIKKYDPDEPIIIVLDSLGLPHAKAVRALKDYILEEGRAKRNMVASIMQNAFYVREAHIPMQPNYTDCGVYLLGYLQKFFADPRGFVTRILTREMDRETDWPDMEAPKIRQTMREILQKLAGQQHEELKTKRKKPKKPESTKPDQTVQAPKQPALTPTERNPSTSVIAGPDQTSLVEAERLTARSPRKTSPKVVIEARSQEHRSLKRRQDRSASHESITWGSEVEEPQPNGRSITPKRRKLEGRAESDLLLEDARPVTLSATVLESPRAQNGTVCDSVKATEPPASSETVGLSDSHRGSSADPIEIEDSQDTIELVSQTPRASRRAFTEEPAVHTKLNPKTRLSQGPDGARSAEIPLSHDHDRHLMDRSSGYFPNSGRIAGATLAEEQKFSHGSRKTGGRHYYHQNSRRDDGNITIPESPPYEEAAGSGS